jgi:hypothetical protein
MLKIVAAAVTALCVFSANPLVYAQSPSDAVRERLSAADWNDLTDLRIGLIKVALQLKPDQEQYWPAIEDAIRSWAKNRQARVSQIAQTVGRLSNDTPMDVLRNRDPVSFLNRRATALAERSADLKKLADAWEPLYPTLSPEQKRHMAALTIFVLHEMADAVEQRRMEFGDR